MTTFDYVRVTYKNGTSKEGFLVAVDGVIGTLQEVNANTAIFMPDATLIVLVKGEQSFVKHPSYIATVDEYGKRFSVKVLASNARSSEFVGSKESLEDAQKMTEQKYGKVTWVTPYRFLKEVTAC